MPITTSSQEELTRELNRDEVHELEKFILETVADKLRDYETPHWFPLAIRPVASGGVD